MFFAGRAIGPVRGLMNEALKMQISAFVDGELPENESELLLRRLSQDAVLRRQVADFLEMGRLIRNDRSIPGMDGLRARISAALGDEQIEGAPSQEVVGSRLMTPTTGVAVAATVAALALLGLSQVNIQTELDVDGAVATIDAESIYTEPSPQEVLSDQPNEQILEYYRRHEMNSDEFARVVNLELREGEVVEIEPDSHLLPAAEDADPVVEDEVDRLDEEI